MRVGRGGERTRVVHILDSLNTGGTELNAVRTAERLDPAVFDVSFLCLQPDGPLRQRLDDAGIPVRGIPVPSVVGRTAFQRGREIRRFVRAERVDIVHAHDPYANILAVPWARLAGRAGVIASHRWWKQVHRRKIAIANRVAYRFAHRVLANSESVGELVVREEGVSRGRVVVIPNFVEEEAFQPLSPDRRASLRERMGVGAGDVVVGIVANLYPVKNHEMLLRAAARLTAEWPAVRFVLVGDGEERARLADMAQGAGILDRVSLPGRISHEPGLSGLFDVAVLTSREEGFPNFVVEAMAAGRPVVATAVGGVPDAVVPGETGYLVAVDDDIALADGLGRLLADPSLRERLGRAGAEVARKRYHVDVVMERLRSLYQGLAERL